MRRLLLVVIAACGVRTPAPIDVASLLARRGPVEARRDLEIRIIADPTDVAAQLGLAELDVQIGRPAEATDHLLFVERLGGPFGPRWHDVDRARLAELLYRRGLARTPRGSGVADLQHARSLGHAVSAAELATASRAAAAAQLRHVDAKERAHARTVLTAADHGIRPVVAAADHGAQGTFAWSIGARREAYEQLAAWHAAAATPRDAALEAAYLRALAWWQPAEVPPPDEAQGPARCWFVSARCTPAAEIVQPLALAAPAGAEPRAWAVTRYALARFSGEPTPLYAIARAFARDAAIAERLGRDYVASSVDAAAAHATIGALFDALGDPQRARENWQAAVSDSPEPAFLRGLAESAARGNDGPAALVFATTAAAAHGDPAVVWSSLAVALEQRGLHVDALTAAHSAIDLGDIETLPSALATAISASRALGRDTHDFERQLAALPASPDRAEALAAVTSLPNAVTLARAWVVSRTLPRDAELRAALYLGLAPDDPRRPTILDELLSLAGDPDSTIGLTAVRALR